MRIDQDNYTALKEHLVVTLERFQRAAARNANSDGFHLERREEIVDK
jgi:hypothetical protein